MSENKTPVSGIGQETPAERLANYLQSCDLLIFLNIVGFWHGYFVYG